MKEPKPRMPLYHLVSAIDPLVDSDITHHVNDGLPETLPQWINYNGLTHFKIKLDGDDLKWDSERVLSVDRVATETEEKRVSPGLGLLARLQRALPQRAVPGGFPEHGEGEIPGRIRADPVRGAAHGARSR